MACSLKWPPKLEHDEEYEMWKEDDGDIEKRALKLHRQFGHPTAEKLKKLVRDADIRDSNLERRIDTVTSDCDVCKRYKKPSPRPVSNTSALRAPSVCGDVEIGFGDSDMDSDDDDHPREIVDVVGEGAQVAVDGHNGDVRQTDTGASASGVLAIPVVRVKMGQRIKGVEKASGESRRSLEFQYRISHNLISSIIPEVCDALFAVLRGTYLKLPTTSAEWQEVASGFSNVWQFPNCIGALDGKHFLVIKPDNTGAEYFDYKSHHSVIMLALVDASYKFLYIDLGPRVVQVMPCMG
ncbi:hypothetical protein GWK47_037553 [Chionoecetes opilio]|uniref:DDE Tnp4 domain-containing protein n=1 Tax=Chionoecetes opilio TaxID=41210 RepID=A0A8J4YET8_CHIOP|nr:hypothetical protein GWK47_037553 [Chionoecetes opilio]